MSEHRARPMSQCWVWTRCPWYGQFYSPSAINGIRYSQVTSNSTWEKSKDYQLRLFSRFNLLKKSLIIFSLFPFKNSIIILGLCLYSRTKSKELWTFAIATGFQILLMGGSPKQHVMYLYLQARGLAWNIDLDSPSFIFNKLWFIILTYSLEFCHSPPTSSRFRKHP